MKKILVTGGAGFIGSHLCEFLLEKGEKVTCLDNLLTGSKNNIEKLFSNKNFYFSKMTINNPISYNGKFDQIYNLACPASPVHYQSDPINTIKTNTIGVINMLELAEKKNSRILQASTSEVYGDPLEHPQSESYLGNVNTIGPRSCYDEGKRVAETLFSDFHREKGVDIRIARIFNTYGPNMAEDDGRVISNFVLQALKNEAITIYGNGEQTRSFCYVSDTVDGLYKLMNKKDFIGPVNLGNPIEFSMNKLAKKIVDLTNSNSNLIYGELPLDDPKKRMPDIILARDKLDWKPKVHLSDGLKKTINYFKE
ncbi:NAD-dependent dehydratase [Candidatus Parvarchaeota archaeon]|nr:MAG: NAD-dependent dehydratase [Candidatus Parvarchaeota archaeon]HIG52072.1 SDR family oxidoreductase [Candidatus Pacearchaeota archaeon]